MSDNEQLKPFDGDADVEGFDDSATDTAVVVAPQGDAANAAALALHRRKRTAYLVDRSSSMDNRWDQKGRPSNHQLVGACLRTDVITRRKDNPLARLNLVAFNSDWSPTSPYPFLDIPALEGDALEKWVYDAAYPEGGTDILQALETTWREIMARDQSFAHVIIITDGLDDIIHRKNVGDWAEAENPTPHDRGGGYNERLLLDISLAPEQTLLGYWVAPKIAELQLDCIFMASERVYDSEAYDFGIKNFEAVCKMAGGKFTIISPKASVKEIQGELAERQRLYLPAPAPPAITG